MSNAAQYEGQDIRVTVSSGKDGRGLVWKRGWNAALPYQRNDAVFYGGLAWVALADLTPGSVPGTHPNWDVLASGTKGDKGEDGEPGAPGTGIVWKGAYSAGVPYNAGDAVSYNGVSWYAVSFLTAGQIPGVSAGWDILASKGADGNPGPAGPDNVLVGYSVVDSLPGQTDVEVRKVNGNWVVRRRSYLRTTLSANILDPQAGEIVNVHDVSDNTWSARMRWNGSTWKQTSDRAFLHIDTYNAPRGNAALDSRPFLDAALVDCISYGTELRLGRGAYSLITPWVVSHFGGAYAVRDGIRISGEDPGDGLSVTGIDIRFNSPTDPAIWLAASYYRLSNFSMSAALSTARCYSAIEIGCLANSGAGSGQVTNNEIKDVVINAAGDDRLPRGITIGTKSPGFNSNNEDHLLDRVKIQSCKNEYVWVGGSGQPYNTQVRKCSFGGTFFTAATGGVGIRIGNNSSQMSIFGTQIGYLERCIWLTNPSRVSVYDMQSEAAKRFLQIDGNSGFHNFAQYGGRFSLYNVSKACETLTAADCRFISCAGAGAQEFHNILFGSGFTAPGFNNDRDAYFDVGGSSVFENCYLPSPRVFESHTANATRTSPLWVRGCRTGGPATATSVQFPDIDGCRNPGRREVFRGSKQMIKVVINREYDAKYTIDLGAATLSAGAALGSGRATIKNRTVDDFELWLDAAPGGAYPGTIETAEIPWTMHRNSVEEAATYQIATTVYGAKMNTFGNYWRSKGPMLADVESSSESFFVGVMFQVQDFSAMSATGYTLLSTYSPGVSMSSLTAAGFPDISGVFNLTAGIARTPVYTFDQPNDAARIMLAMMVFDQPANKCRFYIKNAEVGAGTTPAVSLSPNTTTEGFLGCFSAGGGAGAAGVDFFGAFAGRGLPALADYQAYGASVKAAADLPLAMPNCDMRHVWSYKAANDGAPAGLKFIPDQVGGVTLIRNEAAFPYADAVYYPFPYTGTVTKPLAWSW